MSSRQLKKLRKQQELLDAEKVREDVSHLDDGENDDSDVGQPPPRIAASSGFAALSQLDDDDNEEDGTEEPSPKEPIQLPERTAEITTPSKTKKNKKKGKKGKKAVANPDTKPKQEPDDQDGLDDIDRALEELNIKQNNVSLSAAQEDRHDMSPMGGRFAENNKKISELLRVDSHHLKVMNELRAVFGRETVEAVRADNNRDAPANQSRLEMDLEAFLSGNPTMMANRQAKRVAEVVAKRNPFAQAKDSWPQGTAGGLTMRLVKEFDGYAEYSFAHDRPYIVMETKFFHIVEQLDPHQMVHFLKAFPYHVSSLLQTSDIARGDRNPALATDLCERALYTFGRVTLSAFRKKLEEGKVRMDFRRPENRQFWLAGYQYIKGLIPKGTYRTALEWTKLFLSISPRDEYAMILFAHELAIKAKMAQWYIDLWASSYFDAFPSPIHDYVRQTLVLARLQIQDEDGAIKALMEGMKMLPWLYASLFSVLGLDTPKCIWGFHPRSDSEDLYTKLYLTTAKGLWDTPKAITLLQEVANIVPRPKLDTLVFSSPCPANIARVVFIEGKPELLGLLPEEILQRRPNLGFDPLPPPYEENIFSNISQELPWTAESMRGRDILDDAEGVDHSMYDTITEALGLPSGGLTAPAVASIYNLFNRMRGIGPDVGDDGLNDLDHENDDSEGLPPLEEMGEPEGLDHESDDGGSLPPLEEDGEPEGQ